MTMLVFLNKNGLNIFSPTKINNIYNVSGWYICNVDE